MKLDEKEIELEIELEKASKELHEKDKLIMMLKEVNSITNSKYDINDILRELIEIIRVYLDFDFIVIKYHSDMIEGLITDLYNDDITEFLRSIDVKNMDKEYIKSALSDIYDYYSVINILKNENGLPFGFLLGAKENDHSENAQGNGEVLSIVSTLCSQTIERNSYLLARQKKIILERDLEIAQKIQEAYIPASFPQIDGFSFAAFYKPAKMVGGDYYDWLKISEDMYSFIIGDVSGKGTGAALYMIKARENLRIFSKNARDASIILRNINDNLTSDVDVEKFMTALLVMLDKESKTITLSNAGHDPLFIIRGDLVIELSTDGIPLGIVPNSKYENQEVELQHGDILFMYTDGLVEARNEKKDFYGFDRLTEKLLSIEDKNPKTIIAEIARDVDEFAGNSEQFDDITLLAIKYE